MMPFWVSGENTIHLQNMQNQCEIEYAFNCNKYFIVIFDILVTAEEIDLTTIRSVVLIPDLEVSSKLFGAAKPKKNATVTPKFETK